MYIFKIWRYSSIKYEISKCVYIYIHTYMYIVSDLDMIHLIQLREELLFLSLISLKNLFMKKKN